METSEQIATDLVELLSRLVGQYNGDGPPQDAPTKLTCVRPELGRWITAFDFSFLTETLRLTDEVFCEQFPGLSLSKDYRNEFACLLETHSGQCEYCTSKIANDVVWENFTKRMFAENKEKIGRVLAKAAGK